VEIILELEKAARFPLSLRIPAWSKRTLLEVNGKKLEVRSGEYMALEREWKNGDRIRLELDMRGRIIQAPGSVNDLALMRGPVVLALDKRMVEEQPYNLWLYPDSTCWQFKDELGGLNYVLPDTIDRSGMVKYISLEPVSDKPSGVWMAFKVPFLYRYTHFFGHEVRHLLMCDYASAGNRYSEDNLFRVWLPQPLFMNNVFPEKTWKILDPGEERPGFPQ